MFKKALALTMAACMATAAVPAFAENSEATPIKGELNVVAVKPSVVEDFNTNEFTLWLEGQTGIHINFTQLTSESTSEKVAMMFAGGDLPDAFFGVGFSADSLLQYGNAGAIIPLEDYIEKDCPDLVSAMGYYDQGLALIKQADGHIYSLPSINPCYHCTYANKMWMNTKWLENVGMEAPTTIDEFTEVLRAFRDQDANGNGDANDEIPMSGSTDGWYGQTYPFILNSFLYFDYSTYGFQLDDDGNVYNAMGKDEFRSAMQYLNMLYEEGLMYEGTLTQTMDQLKQQVENPDGNLVGCMTAGFGGQFASNIGDERYQEYYAIAPLKGPEGVQYAMGRLQLPNIGQYVITSNCADVDLAMEWANYFYKNEVAKRMHIGPEGVCWRYAEEGEVGMDGNPAIWYALKPYEGDTGNTQNYCWTEVGIYNASAEWRGGQAVSPDTDLLSADGLEYMLYKVTKELYEPYSGLKYCMPRLNYDPDQQARIADLSYEFQNYYNEVIYGFITGEKDIDSDDEWQEHLDNLQTYGADEMCEIYQAAYDAMYK